MNNHLKDNIYNTSSLSEILEAISLNSDKDMEPESIAAFYVLIEQFSEDLLNKAEIICKKRNFDDGLAVELTNAAFKRYYKYPKFEYLRYNSKEIESKFKQYLYQIANNLIIDYYKDKLGNHPRIYKGDEVVIKEFPEVEHFKLEKRNEIKKRFDIIQKALDRLGPKHKTIYLTYIHYEENGYKLPRELLKKLRKELKLSQSSIRCYKKQAFDTVKTFLDIYG